MNHPLTRTNIAFVTSKDYPDLTVSDRLAARALGEAGARVLLAFWDDPSVDWARFDLIIVRSTWDYHLQPERYLRWIDSLDERRLPLWNPAKILRWNMDKRYLLDLETKGIRVPRTCFLDGKQSIDLFAIRTHLGTDEAVVKPVVSASSWNTWRCSLKDLSAEDKLRLENLPGNATVMVQEFIPEISRDGEWSGVFFGRQFSHSLRKFPREGDFRVQEEWGGRHRHELNPPEDLIRQATEVVATIETPLLYARVDGVVRDGRLVVMELELLEPSLYFDVDPASAYRFVERVVEVMGLK